MHNDADILRYNPDLTINKNLSDVINSLYKKNNSDDEYPEFMDYEEPAHNVPEYFKENSPFDILNRFNECEDNIQYVSDYILKKSEYESYDDIPKDYDYSKDNKKPSHVIESLIETDKIKNEVEKVKDFYNKYVIGSKDEKYYNSVCSYINKNKDTEKENKIDYFVMYTDCLINESVKRFIRRSEDLASEYIFKAEKYDNDTESISKNFLYEDACSSLQHSLKKEENITDSILNSMNNMFYYRNIADSIIKEDGDVNTDSDYHAVCTESYGKAVEKFSESYEKFTDCLRLSNIYRKKTADRIKNKAYLNCF